MNMNTYLPTRLVTGEHCIEKNKKLLNAYGKRCLILTGANSAKKCGALDDITKALEDQKIDYIVFDGIGQNPKLTDCEEAAKLAIKKKAEFIIGIGGGSPLDAAKCVAVLAANKGYAQKELYSLKWKHHPLPVIAVGTTAGTGSEVTKVSVITNYEGRKKSFKDDTIYPALSFGDPVYTTYMSDKFTRSTAVDALAHCVESFFNTTADELSQMYAIRGVQLLLPMLKKIIEQGTDALTYEDREVIYNGSIYGGMAINTTGTALPHAVGYLLTEQHGLPHGVACAVFLPAFFAINKKAKPELVEDFLKRVNTTEEEYLDIVVKALPEYQCVMDEAEIEREHSRWINNGSIKKTHGNVSAEEVDNILRSLFVK